MMHGTSWIAATTIAVLIREAGKLARMLLAYRQQRWMITKTERAHGQIRSIEITGRDRISVKGTRARRPGDGS